MISSTCSARIENHAWSSRRFQNLRDVVFHSVWLALSLVGLAETPPFHSVSPSGSGRPGFSLVASSTSGIQFTNRLTDAQIAQNRLLEDGSGVALGDVDGDGRCDIYLCSLEGSNRLYRNLGDWHFTDVTASAGVACPGQASTGAVLADVDGDRDLDLLVNSLGGGTRLFRNDGKGVFVEVVDSGLLRKMGSHSLALADVDGDGDLDLYVVNYRTSTAKDSPVRVKLRQAGGQWVVPSEHREQFRVDFSASGAVALLEVGEPDQLYLNDGTGRFTPVSWTSGKFLDEQGKPLMEPFRDWGLSAQFRDINQDGLPDLYVCNDYFTPDRIWINQGNGIFRLLPTQAFRQISWASMAVDFADINRDGRDDFFVCEMLSRSHVRRQVQHSLREVDSLPSWGWGVRSSDQGRQTQVMHNVLGLQQDEDTFTEIAQFSGVHASEWSWGCLFLDVDLDGFEDLLIANGHSRDLANSDSLAALNRLPPANDAASRLKTLGLFPPLPLAHVAFRNQGNLTFQDRSHNWGFDFVSAANGMAEGDLDNDGDMDLVVNNLNGEAMLLRNEGLGGRVGVRLRGEGGNSHGIGARIRLKGGSVEQTQEMISGGRYLSGGESMRVFASGEGRGLSLEVRWRSGKVSVVKGVEGNRVYEVEERGGVSEIPNPAPVERPWFREVSEVLGEGHASGEYDDFARQPLMPRKVSQEGPGVVWTDLNGDGKEDLVIGGGRGGRLRVLSGDGKGGFGWVNAAEWSGRSAVEQTGLAVWSAEAGSSTLMVGQSSYEDGVERGVKEYGVFLGQIQSGAGVEGWGSSVGALALGDMDGDGDVDLFVGGRVIPGKYPAAASSRIYWQEKGKWVLDEANSGVLKEVGMVCGAVWTDLDGDGYPELALGCEWGGIRVFGNRGGQLKERTQAMGLGQEQGLWTGITAGDLDGDGRMDLVAGNWGRNTVYEEYLKDGVRIYHGDVDGNGTWDVVESYRSGGKEVPRRDWRTVGQAIPMVGARYTSYRGYGEASLEQVYGEGLKKLGRVEARVLDSKVWLNRGERFEGKALPMEAQWAPVFGLSVGDYDGDGMEDVFVSQNFFGVDRESGRMDGGRGLWLRGTGKGQLEAQEASRTGIRVYGEGRGTALGDYDGDGRVDLVVGQNGGMTRLYHNERAKVGLRVRLEGPAGNATGLGAVLRLGRGDQQGPAREVHGGSGWWSQDSAVSVLAWPKGDGEARLTVRWPGGHITSHPVPKNTREVIATINGTTSQY